MGLILSGKQRENEKWDGCYCNFIVILAYLVFFYIFNNKEIVYAISVWLDSFQCMSGYFLLVWKEKGYIGFPSLFM